MHVAVLIQHYHTPDCATAARPWSLVKALAERHAVTVLTTRAWHERRLTHNFAWAPPGVQMRMLDVSYANEMSTRERLRSYLVYAAKATEKGLAMPRPDLIYASSTPLTVGIAGALLAKRWRCPWVFEIRDLWPDFPVQMGALDGRPLLRRALYALERRLYRSAACVVAASPDMAAHVRRFRSSENVFSLAYGTDFQILDRVSDEDVARLRERLGLADQHVVLYAGSFGRANALPTVLEAARRLQHRSDVRFVFAGRGYHRPALERAADALSSVQLLDPRPYPQALALFRLASLSLVPFIDRPVLATNAPSKFFDSLAAGTPVVVTNPGWTRDFVEKHECGWYAPPSDAAALAGCIEDALAHPEKRAEAGRHGAAVARRQFDRRTLAERLEAILQRAVRTAS